MLLGVAGTLMIVVWAGCMAHLTGRIETIEADLKYKQEPINLYQSSDLIKVMVHNDEDHRSQIYQLQMNVDDLQKRLKKVEPKDVLAP